MRMRRAAALAAAGLVLLAGCGDDVKDAVGDATDKAKALNKLAQVDKEFLKHPEKALQAARETCNFMDRHSDKAKQLDQVRDAFDPIGASDLEAAQARLLLKILNNEVCPLID
jgi:hypothetical protein